MQLLLIIWATGLAAFSGLPGYFLVKHPQRGELWCVICMSGAMLLGLSGAFVGMFSHGVTTMSLLWPAVADGQIGLDPLSAFFLAPVFLIGGLGAIYGSGYWPQRRHPRNGRRLRFFWGVLVAGMAFLLISRHALLFLLGWECMALAAYFLIAVEGHRDENRRAAWIYLILTHFSSLTLFGLFALWHHITGSYLMAPVAVGTISTRMLNICMLLILCGFGTKAGIMPLHFWLPGAHSTAPSHVSAIMSGVVLKMGIYGIIRFNSLLPPAPLAWGALLLMLGISSGVLGILFAIAQQNLKRLLAYSSVENIGIITVGIGLAMIGHSQAQPTLIVLGLAGSLLHVWNHSLFKSLLFFGAGAVLHATHTRDIDCLGGLAKTMPRTAVLFLVGAVAICALPPLNGFASELLIYLGLFKSMILEGGNMFVPLFGVPALATIGALALACFAKVYSAIFLGEGRTRRACQAREVPILMQLPMTILAGICLLLGLLPWLAIAPLNGIITLWLPNNTVVYTLLAQAPLDVISAIAIVTLLCTVGVLYLFARTYANAREGLTWDCGYAAPTPRMQYTATSFTQMLTTLFNSVLKPRQHLPDTFPLFPRPDHAYSHVDEAVLDRLLMPVCRRLENWFAWFHRFQRGLTQHYVLYILIILLLFLSTLFSFKQLFANWFTL